MTEIDPFINLFENFANEEFTAIADSNDLSEYNHVFLDTLSSIDLSTNHLPISERVDLTTLMCNTIQQYVHVFNIGNKQDINKILTGLQESTNEADIILKNFINKAIPDKSGLSRELGTKLIQRLVYLMCLIPLRTFKDIDDLQMIKIASNEHATISQSSIAHRVYISTMLSDKPYISNAVVFENESGETFTTDESRLAVKFPLRSKDFLPIKIRVQSVEDSTYEKVIKKDRAKYKKLFKRFIVEPKFL